jgi:putative peptide modification system cyclase
VWRRPAALAAEMMLVVGIGTGVWFLARPTPAIAFNERDWVVVGDLRNLTGQPVLDESLEQAFRISLEQSRYVNVLSDLKVRDTLALMKQKPGTQLDRAIASEVAIRDGARAVILPTVAEVGGRVRVSAEVIDPHSQTTVYAESADGVGSGSTLGSIDKVTGELREKLGEAIAAIERDSEPLPKVSTSNLDALKAYALGEGKFFGGDPVAALEYYRRALEIDPEFALARAAIGRLQLSQGALPEGRRNLETAIAMRDRLTPREMLSLQVQLARFGPVPQLLARWKQLIEMYPDMLHAQLGFAQDNWMMANRYADSFPHARAAAAQQSPYAAVALYLQAMLLMGQERYVDALQAFGNSRKAGFLGGGFAYAYAFEAQRRFGEADRIFGARGGSSLNRGIEAFEYRLITGVDRGDWHAVDQLLPEARKLAASEALTLEPTWRMWEAGMRVTRDGHATDLLRRHLKWVADNARQLDAVHPILSKDHRLAIGYLAARAGDRALLSDVLAALGPERVVEGYPMASQEYQILLAERDRLAGAPHRAVDRLRRVAKSDDALIAVHVALAQALNDAGATRAAFNEWQWVAAHRGRAFVERGYSGLADTLNIADTTLARLESAELLVDLDEPARAKTELAAFQGAWRGDSLPRALASRVENLQTRLR